jgi:hypothetical protein
MVSVLLTASPRNPHHGPVDDHFFAESPVVRWLAGWVSGIVISKQ